MSNKLYDLLDEPNKLITKASNPVAYIFRSILFHLNISQEIWDKKMKAYLNSPRSVAFGDPKKQVSERNNINRALASDIVTWDSFSKAIRILNPINYNIQLDLVWDDDIVFASGKKKLDTVTFDFKNVHNELHSMFFTLIVQIIDMRDMSNTVDNLLTRHVRKMKDIDQDNSTAVSTAKGNLKKGVFEKTNFTWDMFCKALEVIGIKQARMTINLKWVKKHISHSFNIDFDDHKKIHNYNIA